MIRALVIALVMLGGLWLLLDVDGGGLATLVGTEVSALEAREIVVLGALVAMVLLVLPALFGGYRGRGGSALRDLGSWLLIGGMLVAGYSYRDELGRIAYRIAGEFSPPGSAVGVEQRQAGERAVRIRRRGDGHFVARVTVNGTSVSMLVDTGASTVVLRHSDATALGVDTRSLRYTVPVQTANGVAYAANARLRDVSVGSIALSSVDALVAQPGVLRESLLGMSFLSRLRSYEFAGEFLTFRN